MNILMLNYEFPPLGGGAANANRYLLDRFSDYDDLSIDLITSSPNKYTEEQFSERTTIYKLNVGKDEIHHWTQREILSYSWQALRRARTLVKQRSYDLVHAWFGVPSGILARLIGLPYLVALRGSDVPGYNDRFELQYKILRPILKRIWRDADAVVANSEGLRSLAKQTADVPIRVIPNGVAVDEFDPEYGNGRPLKVLCVSRLVERKGINYLIDAIAAVDNTELTLVGEGEQEASLRRQVDELEIRDRVSFKGYVEHDSIHSYYESADLFVLPSFNEGMSNTLLEAMAAGLPLVTTDTGGTAELVNGNGTVVPKGDNDAIADALRVYRDDSTRRTQEGRRSRELAEEMSWSRVADNYYDIYKNII